MIFVHTLGTASIDVGSCSINPTSPRKFALLLYLAVERGRRVPRPVLQELIFADQADRNARHSLRELVYQLRQLGVPLEANADAIWLAGTAIASDSDEVIHNDSLRPDLVRATASGFLPGFIPTHSETYAEWYDAYRARSISSLTRAMIREIDRAKSSGEWDAAETAARACLALDPLNEVGTLTLAEMLSLLGAKATAVSLLDEYMDGVGRVRPELSIPAKALRRRVEQVRDGGPSRYAPRFIGRSEEMKRLRSLLAQTVRAGAHFAVVSGEPGIGKSRLLSEFHSIIRLEGYRCANVAMHPHDTNRPMGAFVDLVPRLLRLPGALGCSPESMASLQRLIGGTRPSEERRQESELDVIAARMTTAIGDLCESVTAEQPLILMIEDAHNLDQLSFGTVAVLLSERREARLLIVASTREPRHLLRAVRHAERVHHLQLRPLSTESTIALIADVLLPGKAQPPDVPARLVAAANGNPLFAVSLAAHYRDTGDSSSAPVTVLDSIERRIDALSREALTVLATTIALGKHSTTDRLISALEMEPLRLFETLCEVSDVGLLGSQVDHVAPLHPLIAEVMTKKLPAAARRFVSHRVAQVFEHDARLLGSPGFWWEAGVQWGEAGNAERGVAAIRECAKHAMEIGRASDAARMLSEALAFDTTPTTRAAVACELIIAADLSLEPRLVLLGHQALKHVGYSAEHDDIELAERRAVFRIAQCPEDLFHSTKVCLSSEANAQHRLAAATIALKCADVAGTGLEMAEMIERDAGMASFDDVPLVALLEFDLLLNSVKGDWDSAATSAERLLAEVQGCPPGPRALHQQNAGLAFFLGGRIRTALDTWRQGFELARECNSQSLQLRLALALASVNLDAYDNREYDFWIEQAIAVTLQAPEHADYLNLFVVQIEGALSRADLAVAEAWLDRGRSSNVFSTGMTGARWERGLRLIIRTRRGDVTPLDEQLARSIRAERVASISGFRDLEIAAAAEVLSVRHEEEARELIRQYAATERSRRRLVHRELWRVTRNLFSPVELDEVALPVFENGTELESVR